MTSGGRNIFSFELADEKCLSSNRPATCARHANGDVPISECPLGPSASASASGLLLLAVPACGLSDYKARMLDGAGTRKTLSRTGGISGPAGGHAHEEGQVASGQEKADVPVADVFFRPPKGIGAKPNPQQRSSPCGRILPVNATAILRTSKWLSRRTRRTSPTEVLKRYIDAGIPKQLPPRQIPRPGQEPPLTFDRWEYSSGPIGVQPIHETG